MPRPGTASLAHRDLPLCAAVMLMRTFCSLLCASCLCVVPSLPFSTPVHLLHAFFVHVFRLYPLPVWLCKGRHYGIGFHSNRASTCPLVGSPPSLRGHSTGALSLCNPAIPCTSTHGVAEQTFISLGMYSHRGCKFLILCLSSDSDVQHPISDF